MQKYIGTVIFIVVVIVVFLLVLRACQRTKEVEIHQKSTDRGTEISLEIKKERVQ
jgi:hypothetical protein